MTSSATPARITLARERRGWSKATLADACEVSRRTVTDWEAGRTQAPPLDVIAGSLDFPVSFFESDDEHAPIGTEQVSFRALTSMSAKQSKMVLANAATVQSLTEWIDSQFTTPEPDMPSFDEFRPRVVEGYDRVINGPGVLAAAASLRALWNLGRGPIDDLLSVLESRGVRVFGLADDVREVDAFSLWLGERPTIFLNTMKSAERLRFDLAHELGHLFVHRGHVTVGLKSAEVEANMFASELLMPGDGMMARARGQIRFEHVFEMKRYWKVSATALVVRLHDLHLINDWQYRNWMVELSKRGFRRSEPDGVHPERSVLLGAVMRLAREDGWSVRSLAAHLRMPASDLTGALSGLTVTAL